MRDREYKTLKLRLNRIDGNVATAARKKTAWYRLPGQRWSWRSESDREALVLANAQRYAELVNHRLHLRVTSRPSTPAEWQRRLAATTLGALPGWSDHLGRCAGRLEQMNLAIPEKQVFLGVNVDRTQNRWSGLSGVFDTVDVDDIDAVVAGPGFDGRPATADEIEWLLRSSAMPGHVPPRTAGFDAPWESTDLPELTAGVGWNAKPYEPLRVIYDGVERFVVVSVIGRTQTLDSNDPWLCLTDKLDYPVQISATIDVLPSEKVLSMARKTMGKVSAQIAHFAEHGRSDSLPFNLQAAQRRALEIQNEVEQGRSQLSTRVDGWYRLLNDGATKKEAKARAEEIRRLYEPLITVHRPSAQYHLAKEFIPGEKLSSVSYMRQMPVDTAAGAMPTATAAVGHSTGFYLGHTVGAAGKRAVFWNPWRATEQRETSGLAVGVGALGSGKSALMGLLAYQSALSGVQTTILDPSGPLAALCRVPELAARSRHIDLLHARPGQLNPWKVIPDPDRSHYVDGGLFNETEYKHDVALANGERQTLASDVLLMMLPPQIAQHEDTLIALQNACRVESYSSDPSLRGVLATLLSMGRTTEDPGIARRCRVLAGSQPGEGMLGGLAHLPAAQLVFDTGDDRLDAADIADPVLTVITMFGLELPKEGAPQIEWTTDERLGVALLHLSAWLVQRSVYRGDRNRRKFTGFDEAWHLGLVGSGRSLFNRCVRDSRKFNNRVWLTSQNAADLVWRSADPTQQTSSIANLVDARFVFHTEGAGPQREALRLAEIPEGCGYENALATLKVHPRGDVGRSKIRDCVFNDGEGGIERVRIDLSQMSPAARAALDTTADPSKVKALA